MNDGCRGGRAQSPTFQQSRAGPTSSTGPAQQQTAVERGLERCGQPRQGTHQEEQRALGGEPARSLVDELARMDVHREITQRPYALGR